MSTYAIISAYSVMLPVLITARYKVNKVRIERDFTFFIYYLFISALVEITNISLAYFKIRTITLSHVYHVIEFALLAFTLINWEREYRILFSRIALALSVIIAADQLLIEKFDSYGIYGLFFSGMALSILAIRILFLLTVRNINVFYRDGRYWIALGILFYFSIKIILLPLFAQFSFIFPFYIHLAINFLSNILFAVGMICHYNKMRFLSTLCS